mmetsp:Transcript_8919/g.13704  ORF Transcript_8919/g.13704 Transcript_8919/m.13704 type:complete len:163 (-) Transcript_8919:211-699(-)
MSLLKFVKKLLKNQVNRLQLLIFYVMEIMLFLVQLRRVMSLKKIAKPDFGARMTVRLAVAGAFHTDFMAPAVEALKSALKETNIITPRIPVISNVDAKPHSDPDVIKDLLARQVTSPVLWEDSAQAILSAGFEQGYELGPGKVVAGIIKRIDKQAQVTSISV